jgi:hypothetical protein
MMRASLDESIHCWKQHGITMILVREIETAFIRVTIPGYFPIHDLDILCYV